MTDMVPAAAKPLYDVETHLAALMDTEDLVPAEQEEEFGRELQAALKTAIDKRDRVGHFVLHLKSQIDLAKAERQRLESREAFYARALDRMEGYITRVIDSLGLDAKGKRKRLEGETVTLALHGCSERVNVTNEQAVPTKYKRATVTLPAETWELLCNSLPLGLRDKVLSEVTSPKVEVSASAAKLDLKAGVDVPGCELAGGSYVQIL